MIINGTSFFDQPFDSNRKQYEEIRKSIAGQGEDYTTGCLLDYEYIKNLYRLITVDLSRIQQIEFVGQLKKLDRDGNATDAGNDQSMFILTISEKIKETRLKFSQVSVTVL